MTGALVVVQLGDDRSIVVETDETAVRGGAAIGGGGAALRQIDFQSALDTIRAAAGELLSAVRDLADQPSSCEISFGIKLNAEAGAIIAKASAEANFSVKMVWSAPEAA